MREAKEKTEESEKNLKLIQKQQYKKQLHFETLFDDYHGKIHFGFFFTVYYCDFLLAGLVHLEALEMLSRQSAMKLESLVAPLSGRALDDIQETLNEVKELCELPELDTDDSDGMHSANDLATKLATAIEDLDIPIDFQEILK